MSLPSHVVEAVTAGDHEPVSASFLRILFNTPNPGLQGGPPRHLPVLEKALSALVDVRRYQYGRKSDDETTVQKIVGRMRDLGRMRILCRKQRPDLIHHNSAFDYAAILRDAPLVLLAISEKLPIFIKVHGSLPEAFGPGSALFTRARDIVLRNADGIGVLSSIEKEEFEQAFPHVRGKMCVVKNAIRSDFFAVERHEAYEPTVIFLSRFLRKKGPFDLLRAVPLVLEKEPATKFVFAGDGEDAEAFDREIQARNLGASVNRMPHANEQDCLALYAKAWMLVFPTRFPEGMPMVSVEAMTAGVPIISSPTRFARSYMSEGVHVLYNAPDDAVRMAQNILKLCRDPQLRHRMSVANRALTREHFGTDHIAREYVGIYRKLVEERRATSCERARTSIHDIAEARRSTRGAKGN